MSVAVTAASGRLGHATLRALVAASGVQGDVVAIARSPDRIHVDGVIKRCADYQSVVDCAAALEGIDTAIVISAPVVVGTDQLVLHRNAIDAARQAGVRKVVFTSIIGNEKGADTLYAGTQERNRQAEAYLAASGLDWVVGRSGLYLDLDLKHIVRADASGVYRNNGGTGRCGYISIDELGFAFARLALDDRHNGKIFNLAGDCLTQAEIVADANRVFGLHVVYEAMTVEENIARMMQDKGIAARGEGVARMLTGAFECVAKGAFDVPSDFEQATGRVPKSVTQQMEEIKANQA